MSNKPEDIELVSEDKARRAKPEVREPDQLAMQEMQNSHSRNMETLLRGWVGACIGSGPEKSGNTAFFGDRSVFLFYCNCSFPIRLRQAI